jgi:hypothetical protein
MSAAMTAASAVASATAGRAAGRPRANAKVRLRPVPPGRIFGARFGSHFLLSGERCLAAPRARCAVSTPARRPAAFPDGRDRAVTLDAREKPPLLVVPSVLRARAPARSRSPSRSAPVAVGWTSPVRRPRFARARTPLTPRPPGNRPRVPSASPSPQPRSASPPSAWCVPLASRARRRAPHSPRIFPPFRDYAPIREKCRFGSVLHVARASRDAPNTHLIKTRPPRRETRSNLPFFSRFRTIPDDC